MTAPGATTIRVGGYAPREAVHSRALDHFVDFITSQSDGRVTVDVLYNVMDEGRPMAELLDMVVSGELTWCYYSTSYLGSSVPTVDALEIPFLFSSLADAHDALDGAFGSTISEAIAAVHPIEVLGYWDNGFRHLTNSRHPLRTPADCDGLSIRLQPNRVHAALVEAWGMKPVLAELSEGIRLIASGAVDAQENPLANTAAYGVDHEHITLSSHLYGGRGLLAGRTQMAMLDDATADLVRRGARSAIEFQRLAAQRYEVELRARFEAEGRTFIDLTPSERAAFRDAASSVIDDARAAVPGDLLEHGQ